MFSRNFSQFEFWASALLCVEMLLYFHLHIENTLKFHHCHHVYERLRRVVSDMNFERTSYDRFRIQNDTHLFCVTTTRGFVGFSHQTIFSHKIHKAAWHREPWTYVH